MVTLSPKSSENVLYVDSLSDIRHDGAIHKGSQQHSCGSNLDVHEQIIKMI
ncbi:MAG TPA: hypothetical protein VH415_00610 [Nitrososphaeraceae archaeon]